MSELSLSLLQTVLDDSNYDGFKSNSSDIKFMMFTLSSLKPG